jgi:hypothetical protein
VKREVHRHFADHFSQRHPALETSPAVAAAFSPIQGVQEASYGDPLGHIGEEEFDTAILAMPTGKSPGPSGLETDLIKRAGKRARAVLLSLLNRFIVAGRLPPRMLVSHVVLLPKVDNWSGSLSKLRPIALMETPTKLLNSIIIGRLSMAFSREPILASGQDAKRLT